MNQTLQNVQNWLARYTANLKTDCDREEELFAQKQIELNLSKVARNQK